ncbi:MAG: hypothetical protein AAF845_02895 [Bacteroidota bacterium]
MRYTALFAALLLVAGCRDNVTGPDPEPLDLAPRLQGTWTGTFDGRLGTPGFFPFANVEGTFLVTFDIDRLGADFGYTGRIQRGADGATDLYDCQPEPLEITIDRRVSMPCRQGTQFGETLVLRVEAQADTAFQTLTGTVGDRAYPIVLTKSE